MAWNGASTEEPDRSQGDGLPKEVYMVVAFFVALIFFTLGLGGNPTASSLIMWVLLAGYLVLAAGEYLEITWMIALAMVALHAGSIISYYSRPLILPLLIIERSQYHASINFDFVQLIVYSEIARRLLKEKLKRPAQGNHEPGAQGDAAVV